jgi:hypothetical protein
MATQSPAPVARMPGWSWVVLALALGWIALVRVPIVLNATTHLDSDLAVDGLRVAEVAQGRWRWHFPGTPTIGIASALCAAAQMRIWGATPQALASGGVVEYLLLALAVFFTTRAAFGVRAACWSLVPVAFSSNGMVWLAGRLNGGHLFVAVWHTVAIGLFHALLARGGWKRALALGVWCGLGFWHDTMFVVTLGAIVTVGFAAWWRAACARSGWICALAAAAGFALGDAPREIGNRLDPYDAYRDQLSPIYDPDVLLEHTRILAAECLPRLVAGHVLPTMRTDPPPSAVGIPTLSRPADLSSDPLAWLTTLLGLGCFAGSVAALMRGERAQTEPDVPRAAVRWALLLSSALVVAAFILNRNIFNSDNYRYIIDLFPTFAIGFGLLCERLARRGAGGRAAAGLLAMMLGVVQTLDTAEWYRRFGWIDGELCPVRVRLHDALYDWLESHPDVRAIYGGYWDVYRMMYLTGGRVRGFPFPFYPNRFPEWSNTLPGGRPEILVIRPAPEGRRMLEEATKDRPRALLSTPGLSIYDWPLATYRERNAH